MRSEPPSKAGEYKQSEMDDVEQNIVYADSKINNRKLWKTTARKR